MQKDTISTVQSPKEFRINQTEIKDLNIKNILGYNLINGKILNTKKIKYITILFNIIMRLEYFPLQWKSAKIILLLKSGKPIEIPSSYTPISLLPISFKIPRKNHSEAFNKIHNKTPNYSTTVLFQKRISTHENPMRKNCMLPIPRRSHRINRPIEQLLSTPVKVLAKVRNEQILKVE
ncbi:hypothetical protein HZH68_016932 [Vespula germanica]|uniref:Uncharacterized protein n=1 Tax=Vespula germanica TaxID=30212 RepID=A0A834MQJ2_VESGE|nr:hypothetical protein HZH68_016932 [Vespula germanica]